MPGRTTHTAARASVLRLCATSADARTLRVEALASLQQALDFEWYVWMLTDPRTAVGVDPVALVPDLDDLPRLIRLKYTTTVNRWTGLHGARALGGDRTRSPLWREAQRGVGVEDVASVAFRDAHGCWGFLDLWSRRAFEAPDLALLSDLAPHLTAALRARRAATFAQVPAGPAVSGAAVLILDDGLRVVGRTAASAAWEELLLPRPDGAAVPAAAYNVAAQQLAREQGIDDGEALGRTHVADGQWLTLRASRVAPDRQLAVTVEPASAHDRLDVFARAWALSPRETEVLEHLCRGAASAEIAGRMHLSPYTVQDHLTSVFDRTGVRSRRDLVSRVLGVRVGEG